MTFAYELKLNRIFKYNSVKNWRPNNNTTNNNQ